MMHHGFSFIELICVLAIISLLTIFAYPYYTHYILCTHRLEAKVALLDLASRLEHYYALNQTYQTARIAEHGLHNVLTHAESTHGAYLLSIAHATQDQYQIKASPHNALTIRDKMCQAFTLTNTGAEGIDAGPGGNPTGKPHDCWKE